MPAIHPSPACTGRERLDMAVSIGDIDSLKTCSDCGLAFKPSDTRHFHCNHCEDGYDARQSPREQYCSDECFYADKGEGALNQLKADHTVCASCFKYTKKVFRPSDDFLEETSSIEKRAEKKGATYSSGPDGTPVLDITDVEGSTRPVGIRKDGAPREYCYIGLQFPTEHTRYLYGSSGPWVCACGNVDLSEHNELLARQDEDAMVLALLDRLREFFEKGAIQAEPQRDVFFEYFEDRDSDLETATGACLYA